MTAETVLRRSRLSVQANGVGHARPRWRSWALLVLAVELLALIGVGRIALHELRYVDRIYPGVSVAGESLAGFTLDQATQAIRARLTSVPEPAIVLRDGGRTWTLGPADLGVEVDGTATAAAAYRLGRQSLALGGDASVGLLWQGLQTDLLAQWELLRDGATVEPVLNLESNRLALVLQQLAAEVDVLPREARLFVTELGVSGMPGQIGRLLDVDATRSALTELAHAGKGGTVDLVVRERPPALLSVDAAVAQATALLERSYTVTIAEAAGEQQFTVEQSTLRQWLAFTLRPADNGRTQLVVEINEEQVAAFVQRIAEQVNRPAVDVQIDWDPKIGQAIVLQSSQPGQSLDTTAAVAAIAATLSTAIPQAEVSVADRAMSAAGEIMLQVTPISPRIDSARIAEMGIVEQISEGTTYFKGSSAERVHNIVLSARKLRSAVIPPGEEFSFNTIVGDVTAENGFVDSLIIVGDRTEVGVGGGVCQVSTTVFRAAFWAGFPIIERIPHSYWVSWYNEPGLDATIYTPDVDFRFRNDTAHYLLIQPEAGQVREPVPALAGCLSVRAGDEVAGDGGRAGRVKYAGVAASRSLEAKMRFIETIQRRYFPIRGRGMPGRPLPPATLTRLLRQVGQTQAREIACDEAYRFMGQFAERVTRGEDAARFMPQVQQHLDRCPDCRKEFDALLRALDARPA